MRLLLDTHIYIWAVADDPKLKASARMLIQDADEVYISSASIWEAAIKTGLGKLDADVTLLVDGIEASGYRELPVRALHAAMVQHLPNIHRDPFDRILIAQALREPLHFMTADKNLGAYSKLVIVV
jgi:PIN domain nuclease of toxin-antitoxin system